MKKKKHDRFAEFFKTTPNPSMLKVPLTVMRFPFILNILFYRTPCRENEEGLCSF